MAKKPMICPFSKKLCRECSYYVGRHYYLCFFKDYRGYLDDQKEEKSDKKTLSRGSKSLG
jgi:hypothetical protein